MEKMNGTKWAMILTIHNVSHEDFATYTCVASNIKGKTDATVRLYEIKVTTTSSTPTTTTSTTPSTTITNLILEITAVNTKSSERPSVFIPNDIAM
ncbi:hypothetical protein HHI36_023894 [Cryptolaemus montrouzieri]|uniref:Uncharacterized protein n=1 Tax=Cryptolaemus montrouzieri TaxID=559131 RepID=A0ABD2MMI9_9CUCU